ncbi:hypothetical protein FB45DRAFT_742081 [Roridomyces roridus]|uniref:Uncharacterized protein n=1 Tax=Roridomyces roridus TaxID=1738132 RepID=A0AAD7C457_9AGAR|nr:hypothetical protein FB45DRAFT_742081 [Roridomyces roridus]
MPSRAYSYPQPPSGFPQLPFNGPPPKPANLQVNSQDWQNGRWVMNPAFNASQWSLSSSQSWIPGRAWHQQRQQEWQAQQRQMAAAANYNPYKRQPRPPSAEYLATKLSDNPLGLTNMIPREELYGPSTEEGMTVATPWVWNPRGLESDETEQSPDTRNNTNANARRPEPPPPASAPPTVRPSESQSRHSQHREMSDPSPQSTQRRNTMPTRHSSEPPAERRMSSDSLPALNRPLDRPRQYQREGSYQPETFTSTRDLQPTFSSNIVRTPQHYKTHSQLASRMEHLSTHSHSNSAASSQSNGLSRHSSLPAPLDSSTSSLALTGVANLVEEPTSMLSPLVIPAQHTHKPSTRPLGRHSSVPVVGASPLSAIPEGPAADGAARRHSPSRHHSRHTSPATSGSGHILTPPRSNPLPDPPQELTRNPNFTLPVQRTPPASYRIALRKGMWNRRGDHLTVDGFVVYAPVDRAYPDELRDYPAEAVGYRDHLGSQIPYLDRPELPESLPRFGQPPRQPYEKVRFCSACHRLSY